jgi:hypothetical protein
LTALSKIVAGSRILASEIQAVAPLAAYKTADQSVTSSTVLVNDSNLFVSVLASATYWFQCYLDFEGGTNGSSDIKVQWNAPTGATLRWQVFAGGTAGIGTPAGIGTRVQGTAYALGTNGPGSLTAASMWGTLAVSTTAGTLQLQWAQNTSNGTATIVHTQSALTLWQVA